MAAYGPHDFGEGGLNSNLDVGALCDEIGLDEYAWRKPVIDFDEDGIERLESYSVAFEDAAE